MHRSVFFGTKIIADTLKLYRWRYQSKYYEKCVHFKQEDWVTKSYKVHKQGHMNVPDELS